MVPIKVILLRRYILYRWATHCLGVAGQFEVEYRYTVTYYIPVPLYCSPAVPYWFVHCSTLPIFVLHCAVRHQKPVTYLLPTGPIAIVHCNLYGTAFLLHPSCLVRYTVTYYLFISAQLYMIAKKSRQESKGADSGSGVEILVGKIS